MRPFVLAGLLGALSFALPAVSRAEDEEEAAAARPARKSVWRAVDPMPVERGLQLGARVGYALPEGTLSGGSALSTRLSDLETASVPIGIDAGFRFNRSFYVGGTLAWGPGISPNSPGTCPTGASCFRQDAQLRVEARVYFAPDGKTGWWMAFGAGWEVAAFSQNNQGNGVTSTLTGPVLGDVQIGFDSRRAMRAMGPYLGVSIAEFVTDGVSPAATQVPTWIADPGLHVWITLGLHGSYGPW